MEISRPGALCETNCQQHEFRVSLSLCIVPEMPIFMELLVPLCPVVHLHNSHVDHNSILIGILADAFICHILTVAAPFFVASLSLRYDDLGCLHSDTKTTTTQETDHVISSYHIGVLCMCLLVSV